MSLRGRRRHRRRGPARPTKGVVDDGTNQWIEYCGSAMWVVGFTEGGAPYGLLEWEMDRCDGEDNPPIPAKFAPCAPNW
jgi:hypothetical protein